MFPGRQLLCSGGVVTDVDVALSAPFLCRVLSAKLWEALVLWTRGAVLFQAFGGWGGRCCRTHQDSRNSEGVLCEVKPQERAPPGTQGPTCV